MRNFVSNFNRAWVEYSNNMVIVIGEEKLKRYHNNIFAPDAVVRYADHNIDSVRSALSVLKSTRLMIPDKEDLILVVDGADLMTMATSSIMLKYVEQHPMHNKVVLRFNKNYNVPQTLASRSSVIVCEPHNIRALQDYGESIGIPRNTPIVFQASFGFDDLDEVKRFGAKRLVTIAEDIARNLYKLTPAEVLGYTRHLKYMDERGIPSTLLMKFVMHCQHKHDLLYDYVLTAEAMEKIYRGHDEKLTVDRWLITLAEGEI